MLEDHSVIELVAAVVVGVLAVGRFTRLMIHDDFPPTRWMRETYLKATAESEWSGLMDCPFCFATWPALVNVGVAWWSDLAWWWWLPNLWFATAYLAAMVVARDEPPD